MASSLGSAIAAADRLFGADGSATGVVFDLADLGGADPAGRFAAFARCSDLGRPSRLVGFAPTADAASALLARDGRPLHPLGSPAGGLFIPGDRLYRTDLDGNPLGGAS